MISRNLMPKLKHLATKFPVVTILGPRQSGKTTLSKAAFPNYKYVSLEETDNRSFAMSDPREFLRLHCQSGGVIFDEIQEAPDLLSYIQTYVDEKNTEGLFVLTGSHNYLLNQAVTQTLAGRVAILTLLPLSINELENADLLSENLNNVLFKGCYPRLFDKKISPLDWFPNYVRTYVERDIRQIRNVENLTAFQNFMKLCAGRTGQLLNVTSLSDDAGISVATVKAWLSLLESSYIIFLLHPYYKNFSKRVVKSPKIYFYDTGLACFLLGITSKEQLAMHYLRGGLFESFVLSELMKYKYNQGFLPNMYFWRDSHGNELDCVIEEGQKMIGVEVKSGMTINISFFKGLNFWNNLTGSNREDGFVVYAGGEEQRRSVGNIIGWKSLQNIFKK